MARTTGQPSTATRRNARTTQPDTNGLGSADEQIQDTRTDGDNERREGLSAVHDEQNTDRDNSDERGLSENRDRNGRESTSRNEYIEYNEEGARSDQRPATLAAGMDTFAPMLEAWKQVFKSWSELTETMVKVQQDAFASMVSGAKAHTYELNLGENERIDRDRR